MTWRRIYFCSPSWSTPATKWEIWQLWTFLCLSNEPKPSFTTVPAETIEKPLISMVNQRKNIQWGWFSGSKTIEKPLIAMVSSKIHYHPIVVKKITIVEVYPGNWEGFIGNPRPWNQSVTFIYHHSVTTGHWPECDMHFHALQTIFWFRNNLWKWPLRMKNILHLCHSVRSFARHCPVSRWASPLPWLSGTASPSTLTPVRHAWSACCLLHLWLMVVVF